MQSSACTRSLILLWELSQKEYWGLITESLTKIWLCTETTISDYVALQFPKVVSITRGLVLSWALNCECDTSQRHWITRGQSHLLLYLPQTCVFMQDLPQINQSCNKRLRSSEGKKISFTKAVNDNHNPRLFAKQTFPHCRGTHQVQ